MLGGKGAAATAVGRAVDQVERAASKCQPTEDMQMREQPNEVRSALEHTMWSQQAATPAVAGVAAANVAVPQVVAKAVAAPPAVDVAVILVAKVEVAVAVAVAAAVVVAVVVVVRSKRQKPNQRRHQQATVFAAKTQ